MPRSVQLRVLLRSLTIQGSWNYETLIGTGFAFTVLPVLRYLHPSDVVAFRAAVARHTSVFNSHPYLATVAIGAVSRLEADGVDPQMIERFKSALRGSLGSLGDRVVWSAWRPAAVMLGIAMLLAGAVWWVGIAAFLLVYNALHLAMRVWGWRVGYATGLQVGRAMRDAPFEALASRAGGAGALLGGAAVVLAAAPAVGDAAGLVLCAAFAAAGVALGGRTRRAMSAVVGVVWILAFLWGWIR